MPPGTFRREPQLTEALTKIVKSTNTPAAEEKLLDLLDSLTPLRVNAGAFQLTGPSKSLADQISAETDPQKKEVLLKRFKTLCGNSFVIAVHRGARLNLLLTQKVRSRQQKESLAASIGASGYGASAGASFSSFRSETLNTDNLTYSIVQEGGVPAQIRAQIPPSTDAKSKFFDVNSIIPTPDNLLLNPAAFSIEVIPYSRITGFDSGFVPGSPNDLFMVGDYYIVLEELFDLASEIVHVANLPRAAIDRSYYDPDLLRIYGGPNELSLIRDQIHRDLMFLHQVIGQCFADDKTCKLELAASPVQAKITAAANLMDEQITKLDTVIDALRKRNGSTKLSDAPEEKKSVGSVIVTAGLVPAVKEDDAEFVDAALNAVGLSASTSTIEETLEYLTLLANQLRDFREYATASEGFIREGRLSAEFYLRFYHYAANLPIPKAGYQTDQKNLNDFVISYEKARVADKFTAAATTVTNDLRKMILTERLLSWKKFFCEEMKDAPLCVPDAILLQIATPAIKTTDFTVKPKRPDPALQWGKLKPPGFW